jgi:hypothetical protein
MLGVPVAASRMGPTPAAVTHSPYKIIQPISPPTAVKMCSLHKAQPLHPHLGGHATLPRVCVALPVCVGGPTFR